MKKTNVIRRVGLIANTEKPSCRKVIRQAAQLIARSGRVAACDETTAQFCGLSTEVFKDYVALARKVDLLLVCGGDGTMLRVVREMHGVRTPICGINLGRLGFLTAVPSHRLAAALQQIWKGDYTTETRSLMEAVGVAQGQAFEHTAFNDFVVSRGAIPRMIELGVTVNGEPLTRYRCDGLIFGSPTGSTAYSLSAGGAIISPHADVFAITPICPHALSNRSVIVSLDSRIGVKVLSEKVDTTISVDGQVQIDLAAGDEIQIRRSRHVVRLLHPGGSSFFETVRQKLHWSGSNV